MSALISYQRPTASLSSLFDDFFVDNWFSSPSREVTSRTWPRVDIEEEKDAYKLHADLPGLEKKDIDINVEKGVLTISGEKSSEKKDRKKDEYSYYERSYGKFSRSFQLPEHVDESNIAASYKNGVLELTIKKTEKALPKKIEVKIN